MEDTRLPVTVVTGFLGSGKTTLINYILSQDHGRRVAVIENEFGEIGIDNELIVGKEDLEGEGDLMILENGCLCCTVRDDLVKALNSLVARGGFDHVLVETTGVANPAPIISTFLVEPSLQEKIRMDGVCTVVDAKHVSKHLDRKEETGEQNEACAQLAYADRIILNKTDLVSAAELSSLSDRVKGINSLAAMQESKKSVVPIDYVLGIGGYALEEVATTVEKELAALEAAASAHTHNHDHTHDHGDCNDPSCTDPTHNHSQSHEPSDCAPDCTDPTHNHGHSHAEAHDHSHDHNHGHSHAAEDCSEPGCTDPTHNHSEGGAHVHHKNIHDDEVKSASFEIEGAMDLAKLNLWLGALLEVRADDIYRMKGILNIKHNKERFVFQGVHNLFEGSPEREWKEGEKRSSRMVFIGRNLDAELLREGFADCLHDESETAAFSTPEEATV